MLSFDVRDALRGLLHDRLYSCITVVALALTIGATTGVFSIVDGVLLKPLIGVYASTAYGVSRRRREMNIRVALGAAALGSVVASLLFDVRARDPLVIGAVAGLVGAGALVVAAKQSLVLDPAAALRDE